MVAGAGQKRRHQADHHVLHGDVDSSVAAVAAFVEEGSDRQRGHQAGVVAGLMAAQGDRRAVDVSGAGRHLVDESAAVGEREFAGGRSRAGSREAVGRDRGDDQVRRRLRWRFAVDDQGVGGPEQAVEGAAIVLVVQVEHDSPFARIAVEEERRAFRVGAVRPAGGVARGRLDLDHVGAEVGKQLAAVRAGDALGEFDDPQTREGAGSVEGTRGRSRCVRSGHRSL